MNRLLTITLLLISGSALAFGQHKDAAQSLSLSPEQQVRHAESALWRAYVTHDTSAFERLFGDELTFTKENGIIISKEIEILCQAYRREMMGSRSSSTDESGHPGHQVRSVRLYGDMGVVTGHLEEQDTDGTVFRVHYTNTWVRRADGWQVVAMQITTVSPQVMRLMVGTAEQ